MKATKFSLERCNGGTAIEFITQRDLQCEARGSGAAQLRWNRPLVQMIPGHNVVLSVDKRESEGLSILMRCSKSNDNGRLAGSVRQALTLYDFAIRQTKARGDVLDVDRQQWPNGPSLTLRHCIAKNYPCVPRLAAVLHEHWEVEYRRYVNAMKTPWFGDYPSEHAAWQREVAKRIERRAMLLEVAELLMAGQIRAADRLMRRYRLYG